MGLLSRRKRLSIGVIGSPSCGKTYLLFDLIHAFHILGFRPRVLPLNYPYSSFGTFFYDAFNADTGGMNTTEVHACRSSNHYGAHLVGPQSSKIDVNFLNIAGEAFKDLPAMKHFFELKDVISRSKSGLFTQALFRSPSDHEIRLVLPSPDFEFSLESFDTIEVDTMPRRFEDMRWEYILSLLKRGDYREVNRKKLSGTYLLEHLSEYMTDSFLLTLKALWKLIKNQLTEDLTYYEENVFNHFYALTYCQNATDLIICDNLMINGSAIDLIRWVSAYLDELTSHAPRVYLAFRNADMLLGDKDKQSKYQCLAKGGTCDVATRNMLYSSMVTELESALQQPDGDWMGENTKTHIFSALGKNYTDGFKELLMKSMNRGNSSSKSVLFDLLPPHVYFTSTPIDADFNIYHNDSKDPTRFILDTGKSVKSFIRETEDDMERHLCFGSLQLLIDVLMQNGCLPSSIKNTLNDSLIYFTGNKKVIA